MRRSGVTPQFPFDSRTREPNGNFFFHRTRFLTYFLRKPTSRKRTFDKMSSVTTQPYCPFGQFSNNTYATAFQSYIHAFGFRFIPRPFCFRNSFLSLTKFERHSVILFSSVFLQTILHGAHLRPKCFASASTHFPPQVPISNCHAATMHKSYTVRFLSGYCLAIFYMAHETTRLLPWWLTE
jgi:hypothetical protein